MACVVSKHIFGGGVYSTTHNRLLKMVGSGQRKLCEITVQRRGRGIRLPNGVYRANMEEPYMPEKLTDPYHPGGNSICFMIQTAHLMGFDPIYAMGFTLESGSPYAFGRTNPVTRKASFYDGEVPLHWLRWYEARYPGRVRLMPGWSGPVYEVFQTEGFDGGTRLRSLRGDGSAEVGGCTAESDADAHRGVDADVE
jgi:hypothetical protein